MGYEDLRKFVNEMSFCGEIMLRCKDGRFSEMSSINVGRFVMGDHVSLYSGLWFACKVWVCGHVNFGLVLRTGGRLWVSSVDEVREVCRLMRGDEMQNVYAGIGSGLRACGMIPIRGWR